jgi:hypothetical protein
MNITKPTSNSLGRIASLNDQVKRAPLGSKERRNALARRRSAQKRAMRRAQAQARGR